MGAADNLIVETGAQVSGSNTYATIDEFFTYIDNRGLTISATSDHDYVATLLIRAADYIEGKRARFQGDKTGDAQSMQFPRTDLYLDGVLVSSSTIPTELKNAQIRIAYDIDNLSLSEAAPSIKAQDKGDVVMEKVGDIEVRYAESGNKSSMPYFSEAENLLKPFYKPSRFGMVKG